MSLLTADNLSYYLIEKGYVSRESIVESDYLVIDYRRRNRNFKVIRRNYPSYFVKQVLKPEPEPISTLAREASCYWLAQTQPELAGWRAIAPRFVGFDRDQHVLVVELLAGSETLVDRFRREGSLSEAIAAEAGTMLAGYHTRAGAWLMESQFRQVFSRVTPWILALHLTQPEHFPVLSAGNRVLHDIVKADAELPAKLDALRAEWQVNSLLHGDIKWENFLIQPGNGTGSLKLVDWEMADLGDARWDAGAFLQTFLVFWVLFDQPTPMHASIRAFWEAYRQGRQLENPEEFLMGSIRFGAARLIQSAFECLYYAETITAKAVTLLQLSLNILKDARAARSMLLGL